MPSRSQKQHNLMAMVAHDPAAARRLGIPMSVGREYMSADTGRHFSSAGGRKKSDKHAALKKALAHRRAR